MSAASLGDLPEAPDAIATTVSFVLVSPSTLQALNVTSLASVRARANTGLLHHRVGEDEDEHGGVRQAAHVGMNHAGALADGQHLRAVGLGLGDFGPAIGRADGLREIFVTFGA